jgi:GT2 family glycosyltransferase
MTGARILPNPLHSGAAFNPRISVVVLTHDRPNELRATVASLLALPERPHVIVVDNGSMVSVADLLGREFPSVHVISSKTNLGAAGRNLGVERVLTDYVAFCDDDTRWEAGALGAAADLFDHHPAVGILNARVVVDPGGQTDPTCERMRASPLSSNKLPGPSLIGFMAGASVFRTGVYRAAGGYEPRLFIGGEETLLSLDTLTLGWAIVYAPQLVLRHHPSAQRDAALRRRMLARNRAVVAWLRLPIAQALAATGQAIWTMQRERALVTGLRDFLRLIIWACVRRRPVSQRILRMRRQVRIAERNVSHT